MLQCSAMTQSLDDHDADHIAMGRPVLDLVSTIKAVLEYRQVIGHTHSVSIAMAVRCPMTR